MHINTDTNLDLAYLDLMSAGDADMKKMLIEMILEELPNEVHSLCQYTEASDFDNAHKISHKMKSTLSYVGSKELDDLNNEIMDLSKQNQDMPRIELLAQQLKAEHNNALDQLRSILSNL